MTFSEEPIVRLAVLFGGDLSKVAERMKVGQRVVETEIARLRGKYDTEFFAEHTLKVRNKDGGLVPLKPKKGQRKIQAAIDRQRAAGRPVRIKLIKARQFGGSTWIQGDWFRDLTYEEHKQFLTVCHDLDSAKNMRAIFDRFYKNYPFAKPERKGSEGEKWWKFPSKDIDYIVDTADELAAGRSFTFHRLHASEVAFYRDPETLMLGLLQAVPNTPDSIIIIESTANGIGDWFHRFITADNGFELVFVGWHEIEEYTMPFLSDKDRTVLESSLTDAERLYLGNGVTLEQLNWRRYTIENALNGDEDKFKQEYPFTVEEAFIASGRPYFKIAEVNKNLVRTQELNPITGYLERRDGRVDFVPDMSGWWKVFRHPAEDWENRFVTGSDAAEGKAEKANKDPDFSSTTVRDRVEKEDAARFTARVDVDIFADEIEKASLYWGSACDCIERNGPGLAVITLLKDKPINLYRKMVAGKVEEGETLEYGFHTDQNSREMLLMDLRTQIRTGAYKSDDHDFWREAASFVMDNKGKPQAQPGSHDDRVFGAALSIQAEFQANELAPVVRPEPKVITDNTDIWNAESQESIYALY